MKTTRSVIALSCFSVLFSLACSPERSSSDSSTKSHGDSEVLPVSAEAVDEVDEGVVYTMFDESTSDTPIKTQIEQHIVARGIPSHGGLAAEIADDMLKPRLVVVSATTTPRRISTSTSTDRRSRRGRGRACGSA